MSQRPHPPRFRPLRQFYRRYALLCLTLLFLLSVWVPTAIARIPDTTTTYSQTDPTSPIDRARQLYQQGELQAAETLLERAIVTFESQGDPLNQAIALSNLSLIDQQQAQWEQAQQRIDRSIDLLRSLDTNSLVLAQSLDIRAQLQLTVGQAEAALESWQAANQIYTEGDWHDKVLANQINQAQAMQNLGLYPRACQTLLEALEIRRDRLESEGDRVLSQTWECALQPGELDSLIARLEPQLQSSSVPDHLALQLRGLRSLGDVLRTVGTLDGEERNDIKVDGAIELLDWLSTSLEKVNAFPEQRAAILLSLADTERALARRALVRELDLREPVKSALSHYDRVIEDSEGTDRVRARVNYLTLLAEFGSTLKEEGINVEEEIQQHWSQLQEQFRALPATQDEIYTQLHLVRQYFRGDRQQNEAANPYDFIQLAEVEEILDRTQRQAETIGSDRAKAYVLGYKGQLQETRRNWQEAERLTQNAIALATRETANDAAPEITYRLFWQLGRIDKAQNKQEEALSAYSQAFDLLKSIRRDLIAIATENQFNFRDSVSPLYRQFVDLLLAPGKEPTVDKLKKAREAIEALQLAELDDYFQDACSEVKAINLDRVVDEVEEGTAVIYSILLDDRLEIVLKVPGQPLQHYRTTFDDVNIAIDKIRELRTLLLSSGKRNPIFEVSKGIYQWLIAPIENSLLENNIETLVFVLDGELRNISMSVLYDEQNQKYLIEKYAVVLSPGLQLFPPESLTETRLEALTAGIVDSPVFQEQSLSSIPRVREQLAEVRSQIPVVEELLDDEFVKQNFVLSVEELNFSVLHLATHGRFSSNPSKTFIALYDRLLDPDELGTLLRSAERQEKQPIELIVLSVCQTAKGDDRAVLGLSGIAVRSGARSTLATLWNANQVSTDRLIAQFYKQLRIPGMTKAKAIQEAQRFLIGSEDDPHLWGNFILVGNWL